MKRSLQSAWLLCTSINCNIPRANYIILTLCVGSVQVCNQFNCHKLTYYFCSNETQAPPAKNTSAVLMQSQREWRLPAKVKGDKLRGDQRMFNDVVELVWSSSNQFVHTVVDQRRHLWKMNWSVLWRKENKLFDQYASYVDQRAKSRIQGELPQTKREGKPEMLLHYIASCIAFTSLHCHCYCTCDFMYPL